MNKLVYTLCLLVLLAACKKSTDDPAPLKSDEPQVSADTVFYQLRRVENFRGDTTDADPDAPRRAIFFSLEDRTVRADTYQKTSKWDLAFADIYNSFLSPNNGKNPQNYGYGTSAQGGILILEQKFEDVVDVPADSAFDTGGGGIGTDYNGDFGAGTGWYLYDFAGSLAGDGSYDKQHIAYALSEGMALNSGVKVNPRTLVVRTAAGNYAKLKMISVYKNAFTRDKWFRNTPHMYFTFEYVIVPKGSTKFSIK